MPFHLRRRIGRAALLVAERTGQLPPPAPPVVPAPDEAMIAAAARMAKMTKLETAHEQFPVRHERIGAHLGHLLAEAGVTGGRALEIGGRLDPHDALFAGFDYQNLDLEETGPGVIRGDITHCPELPSESFDAIVSVDVFEHIQEPWKASAEITRLLRPGGFTYHSTLWSWRYHPCPVDYWRYSPDALKFLFRDLELIASDLDPLERRRNLIGRDNNRVTPDAFGGWRENWRVFYAGRKPA